VSKTTLSSDAQINHYCEHLKTLLAKGGHLIVSVERERQRTLTMNRAMRMYWKLLSNALNDAGLDMDTVLSEGTEIPWSESKVEEHIWRKIQTAETGKESTKDLSTKEMTAIYEIINRYLSGKFGVFVPWPCQENFRSYE